MSVYLSKSDFKLGSDCPQKLWYKKQNYPTNFEGDEYMQYLAKGGYIVGKMAQLLYPNGQDLSRFGWKEAEQLTKQLISHHENIIIYEATITANNKLVRVDILEKKGNTLHVIEVKAKSQNSEDEDDNKNMKKYIDDLIYQVVTAEEAYPQCKITGSLFLPDKSKPNQIEGLAGWFTIKEQKREVDELEEAPHRNKFNVPDVEFIYENDPLREDKLQLLKQYSIMELRDVLKTDFNGNWDSEKVRFKNTAKTLLNGCLHGFTAERDFKLNRNCKKCEFNTEQQSGKAECWKEFEGRDLFALGLYKIGNRGKYIDELIANKTLGLDDLDLEKLSNTTKGKPLSNMAVRQLMQIRAQKEKKDIIEFEVLAETMEKMQFPLYFIDFETFTGAIPFHKNMVPYEDIAFQWSCHKLEEDGTLKHYEWINEEEGFPSFRFAESLMQCVGEKGTPLMWSNHENKILKRIMKQMDAMEYTNPVLKQWLMDMTHDKDAKRKGRLVDMALICEIAYMPFNCVNGGYSIKKILPAIWNNKQNAFLHHDSSFKRYYACDETGKIIDPYKTLGSVTEFEDEIELEAEEAVAGGTAAMRAYFEMMFGKGRTNPAKKAEYKQLLLQYCELDTVAMVIIYKYWNEIRRQSPHVESTIFPLRNI